jgi:hypothetical protein
VAIDGCNFELSEEPDKIAHFRAQGSRTGHTTATRRPNTLFWSDIANHAILAARIDSYCASWGSVYGPLLGHMDSTRCALPIEASMFFSTGEQPKLRARSCYSAEPTAGSCLCCIPARRLLSQRNQLSKALSLAVSNPDCTAVILDARPVTVQKREKIFQPNTVTTLPHAVAECRLGLASTGIQLCPGLGHPAQGALIAIKT